MEYSEVYEAWLHSPKIDAETKDEIKSLLNDEKELKHRFGSYLKFGTAGLRAKMGAGTNRMNIYTVAHVTEGVAQFIRSLGDASMARGVVIAYDNRNNSALFARRAAEVLAHSGIRAYLFDGVRPTPELSFAVRYLNCQAGINITASHNPKEYNGYKLYGSDGSQPTEESIASIRTFVDDIDILEDVPITDPQNGLIRSIGNEIDLAFLDAVYGEAINPDVVKQASDTLSVVYTPLFGAGAKFVPEIMRRIGLNKIFTVDEQMIHDGNFPGLLKPNPEYPASFELGIKLAEKVNSDLIIATDPDADRVGVMAKGRDGVFKTISGNQMGSLLLNYILTALQEKGDLPSDAYAVKTIVTTEMAQVICEHFGIKLHNVLTGFKFISEVIRKHEESGTGTFILGFEESYGYLKGLHARDKDSVVTSMLICEMAAYYHLRGMTLLDALDELFEIYGYFNEDTSEIYEDTPDGHEKIAAMMDTLRNHVPDKIGDSSVVSISDYLSGTVRDIKSGSVTPTNLPLSNVVCFRTAAGNNVIARPSGTEPKIKFYVLARGDKRETSLNAVAACKRTLEDILSLEHGSLKK
ncbi:MAG: phospho-sugar mutase [Clostridia bacterium]|nr:phospho-sugar mutase [Clostridia bacterium]